jgi:hypothetical protein
MVTFISLCRDDDACLNKILTRVSQNLISTQLIQTSHKGISKKSPHKYLYKYRHEMADFLSKKRVVDT